MSVAVAEARTTPEVRCEHCGRLMARQVRAGSQFSLACPRCRAVYVVTVDRYGGVSTHETRGPQTDTRKPWERRR